MQCTRCSLFLRVLETKRIRNPTSDNILIFDCLCVCVYIYAISTFFKHHNFKVKLINLHISSTLFTSPIHYEYSTDLLIDCEILFFSEDSLPIYFQSLSWAS